MSYIEAMTLFGIMLGLSAIPSASVMLVIGRSVSLGLANGIAVAIGIVLADLVFITLAILGLAFVAEIMGSQFLVINYFGAAYLIFIGLKLLRNQYQVDMKSGERSHQGDLIKSLLAGFLLTLSDLKAIVFYVSLLPAFLDLTALSVFDISSLIIITIVSVGGMKVFYAVSAHKMIALLNRQETAANQKTKNQSNLFGVKEVNRVTGVLMIIAAMFLIIQS